MNDLDVEVDEDETIGEALVRECAENLDTLGVRVGDGHVVLDVEHVEVGDRDEDGGVPVRIETAGRYEPPAGYESSDEVNHE